MPKKKKKVEFRYYDIPKGDYILPKLGKGWEQEYGKGYDGMLHFHNYMEVGYCYHGKGQMIIEDKVYRYGDHMFTVIPANVPHTTISDPGNICKWEFLFIDIDNFFRTECRNSELDIETIIKNINSRGTLKTRENHPVMARLILNIIRECRNKSPYYKESLKGYLYTFAFEILRINRERSEAEKTPRLKVNSYIRSSLEYIGVHYAEDIHIGDLAEVAGLSESHFRRTFEESMNMKPVQYVNMIRINKACEMIQKEDMSMEEIGLKVGYQTQSTFNRNFKAITGVTPLQWKQEGKDHDSVLSNFKITAERGWEGVGIDRLPNSK